MSANIAIWSISALTALAILLRPWRCSEAVWAVAAASLLIVSALVPWRQAVAAVAQGTDVYLFLVGMMLLAELARREGLFAWLAALATRRARGSPRRLFGSIFLVGTVVTILLSNDATAVVLTPAVYAAARSARADPRPYLFICAFIANAASFVLPISNPANLVVFGTHLPRLADWLARFALPSVAAIGMTYVLLRSTQRRALISPIVTDVALPPLTAGARLTALGVAATAALLLIANATGHSLGTPTLIAAGLTALTVLLHTRHSPWPLLKGVHWPVLPLVAGLFVMVQGLQRTGLLGTLSAALLSYARHFPRLASWSAGGIAALASNGLNNLPVALIARYSVAGAPAQVRLTSSLLIGVDLGPNLAATGSLATLLWLSALRREGQQIGALAFLRLGVLVMPPALLLALAATLLT